MSSKPRPLPQYIQGLMKRVSVKDIRYIINNQNTINQYLSNVQTKQNNKRRREEKRKNMKNKVEDRIRNEVATEVRRENAERKKQNKDKGRRRPLSNETELIF